MSMDSTLKFLVDNQKDVLSFLKTRYHLYHLSNVFFRDIHYGIMAYLEWKGISAGYTPSEKHAQVLVDSLVKAGILSNVDRNAYVLNYPEFRKPPVKPAAPAKPAAGASVAAQRPTAAPAGAKPAGVAEAVKPSQAAGGGQSDRGT